MRITIFTTLAIACFSLFTFTEALAPDTLSPRHAREISNELEERSGNKQEFKINKRRGLRKALSSELLVGYKKRKRTRASDDSVGRCEHSADCIPRGRPDVPRLK